MVSYDADSLVLKSDSLVRWYNLNKDSNASSRWNSLYLAHDSSANSITDIAIDRDGTTLVIGEGLNGFNCSRQWFNSDLKKR